MGRLSRGRAVCLLKSKLLVETHQKPRGNQGRAQLYPTGIQGLEKQSLNKEGTRVPTAGRGPC